MKTQTTMPMRSEAVESTERRQSRRPPARPPARPALRFTPTAWAKLRFLRDIGPNEIGGFGVSLTDDLLAINEVHLVHQTSSPVTVKFDDVSVADFFESQVDRGLRPEQFGRVWVHTHPGNSARPSGTDEATFERAFGRADWAVMFILAQGGETYARLKFNVGPGGSMRIPLRIDFARQFAASDWAAWERDYREQVRDWSPLPGDAEITALSYPRLLEPSPLGSGADREHVPEWLEAWREYAAHGEGDSGATRKVSVGPTRNQRERNRHD